jgi:hypothetical protein
MYLFVPFTSSMRVMARFGVWTAFMTAALAGWGTLRLAEATERRWGPGVRGAWPAAIVAAVAFESLTVFSMLPLTPRAVDVWLKSQPADTVIAELPVAQGLRPSQNYWATIHGLPTVFSWLGDSFPPPELEQRVKMLRDFPSPNSVEFLKSIGTTLVLVDSSQAPNWDSLGPALERAGGLRFVDAIGDVRVYRVLR